MKSLGFTGTQVGMTPKQRAAVETFLRENGPSVVHHGDCVGADAQFHDAATSVIACVTVEIHPPKKAIKRAWKKGHKMHPQKEYLERNVDIVNESDELLATPKEFLEEIRSGTWYTVRQARKRGKRVTIIFPDGSIQYNEPSPTLFNQG